MSVRALEHTIIPAVVIICGTALLITGTADLPTVLTMISASGAYGAGTVLAHALTGGRK